ncbi:MAG: DUF4928 family protein, partial [Gemmataceae bacterium]
AEETGKRGPVAQYLVGAKLQLRFPDVDVRNECFSAADDPSGQPGDFVVEDTTFHVTVSPTSGHFEKCKRNLQDGRRVFLLVPDSVLAGTRLHTEFPLVLKRTWGRHDCEALLRVSAFGVWM